MSNNICLKQNRRIRLGLVLIEDADWIGGSIYVRNVVYILSKLPDQSRPEIQLVGIRDPDSPLVRDLCAFDFVRRPGTDSTGRFSSWSGLINRVVQLLYGHVHLKAVAGALPGPDILFPGFGVRALGPPKLYWVPDFQHVHLPHLFSREEREQRTKGMAEIARENGVLLLSSQAAWQDFRKLFPDARIKPRVWSFCSSLDVAEGEGGSIAKYDLPEKFFYLPNQFWAHKDHLTVFQALVILKARDIRPSLVCTGLERDRRNPEHFPKLVDFVKQNGLDGQVRFLGMVPRNDQVQIFRHAAAVIQPSLFEGWSTVVEDTKTLGRPIILSDIPPHREQIALDRGSFFHAGSAEDLARVIEERWESLAPGPNDEAERTTMAHTADRRVELARKFMEILEESIAIAAKSS